MPIIPYENDYSILIALYYITYDFNAFGLTTDNKSRWIPLLIEIGSISQVVQLKIGLLYALSHKKREKTVV